MTGVFEDLLSRLPPAEAGNVLVLPWTDKVGYYAGRDSDGCAALLIKAIGGSFSVPVEAAGLCANFDVPCTIKEPGSPKKVERLSIIICRSVEPATESYFAAIAESLVELLGRTPTTEQIAIAVGSLVDLFQKLRRPPRRPLLGLVGELLVIHAARDLRAAVRAWRIDPEDRYDFSVGSLRLEAKASSSRRRMHSMSFEQANPPQDTIGYLASVMVEQLAGGTSVSELIQSISVRLADPIAVIRLRSVVADTIGHDLSGAMNWKFDLAQANSSLQFYDLRKIPAIRDALPAGVTGVRFITDLSATLSVPAASHGLLEPAAQSVLPTFGRPARRP